MEENDISDESKERISSFIYNQIPFFDIKNKLNMALYVKDYIKNISEKFQFTNLTISDSLNKTMTVSGQWMYNGNIELSRFDGEIIFYDTNNEIIGNEAIVGFERDVVFNGRCTSSL